MAAWKELYNLVLNKHLGKIHPDFEVLDFINHFFFYHDADNDLTREFFTSGNCYWFAVILKERFKDRLPIIWYDTIDNHFVTEIHGTLYDANGVWAPINGMTLDEFDAFYIWEDYKKIDPTHAARITKYCIEKHANADSEIG